MFCRAIAAGSEQRYRKLEPADIASLVDAIERIAAFAFAHRNSLREIDLNPIFVGAEGCVIADALIVPVQPK